jgi:hypothetical protein
LEDLHWIVPELSVSVYSQPGPPIWQRFSSDPGLDPKWQSETIAHNWSMHGSIILESRLSTCREAYSYVGCKYAIECIWEYN